MISIYDIRPGDQASQSKTFVEADVVLFACMTGNFNPVHIDQEFARRKALKQCVVHDMLVAGLISSVLGTQLPGPGGRLTRQSLTFFDPVFVGDTVTARVQVTKCNMDGSQVLLSVHCSNQNGHDVARGDVLMTLRTQESAQRRYQIEGLEIHA